MKRLFVLFLFLSLSAHVFGVDSAGVIKKYKLKEDYDSFSGSSRIYKTTKAPLFFEIYTDAFGSPVLKMTCRMHKYGSWLFVRKCQIKIDQPAGLYSLMDVPFQNPKRDNTHDQVWEWVALRGKELAAFSAALKYLESSTVYKVTLRFSGEQYTHDEKLSDGEISAAKTMLSAYKDLGGVL